MNTLMRPCLALLGKDLEGGWKVDAMVAKSAGATGGTFSAQYTVIDVNGKKAFLKAFDFSSAMQSADWVDEINKMTSEYIFERDIYEQCKNSKLRNVVTPLAHGEVDTGVGGVFSKVKYIIFELAEGDLRGTKESVKHDVEWIFRNLHNAAVGLQQLHGQQIAHQDLKPSNVLLFKQKTAKVSDLGRASDKKNPFKWDALIHAGDCGYAPFERHWGIGCTEFVDRFATDLFMLGNLIFFYFIDVSITLATCYKAQNANANYDGGTYENALPYLLKAFDEVLVDLGDALEKKCPEIKGDVVELARELCHPDPAKRGAPGMQDKQMKYSMQRYISKFDRLAFRSRAPINVG